MLLYILCILSEQYFYFLTFLFFNMQRIHQSIRIKLRQHIRHKQVQELFQQARQQQLFHSLIQHYHQLQHQIQTNSNQPNNPQLVQKLTIMINNHPSRECTYILVGNYLLDHADAIPTFHHVLSNTKDRGIFAHYAWVLQVMLRQNTTTQMMDFYNAEIQQLIQQASSQEEKGIVLEVLKQLVDVGGYWPQCSIDALCESMKGISGYGPFFSVVYYEVMCAIWRHQEGGHMVKHHLEFMLDTIENFLQQFPIQRQQTLEICLSYLDSHFCMMIDGFFAHKTLLNYLKYIYLTLSKHQFLVIKIFVRICGKGTLENIINLLNIGVQQVIVEGLNSDNEQIIHLGLEGVRAILLPIDEMGEYQLKEKVLTSMEDHSLDLYLSQLTQRQLPENTQTILSGIIDKYYSDT